MVFVLIVNAGNEECVKRKQHRQEGLLTRDIT